MMFNASDLKSSNNTLYEHATGDGKEYWYAVRDLGTALGDTGRLAPMKNDPGTFERTSFIKSVRNGFVEFDYHGYHQELIRDRITPDNVRWACDLLGVLTDRQWQEAFFAGGYSRESAARFIAELRKRIAAGRVLAS
jgi:hypothetical protein